jgi:hypothetical protein
LYLVPCSQTAIVCFTREPIARASVYSNEEDEAIFNEQRNQYVKELCRNVEHKHLKRRNKNKQRRYQKDREELMR